MSEHSLLHYCPDLLSYTRRRTREVLVGNVGIGGDHPIRVQSMITADTRDTLACVKEVLELADAGCEIVRITAQTKVYAANLENIAREVRAAGCEVPLVADIHFKPDAALEAAKWVEKVRVNPGNYADKKKFEIREYTDAQYEEELERIREQFAPLVEMCKDLGRAMRIGTNHGSLSDRIMNRYGDTPLGMVESALEFARIARDLDYHNFVFSMKASNPKVMIEAYRLLVARLSEEGDDWNYPMHVGVTEAGDGEDGRIKSAIGIGSLLADGIGDTVRVSLTEDPVFEIPVARALAEPFQNKGGWSVPLQSVQGASRPSFNQTAASIRPNWEHLERGTSTNLPHWRIPGATYTVTFRLDDALPDTVMTEHRDRRLMLLKRIEKAIAAAGSRNALGEILPLREEIRELQESLIEPTLHENHGECHLANPEVAELVEKALRHFDGSRYTLHAWSVMPNHVHAVVTPAEGFDLAGVTHSWKSFTAKEANRLLGRTGPFWQEESYDHIVRDADDFRNQVRYVLRNPGEDGGKWTGSPYGASWDEVEAGRSDHGLERDAPATPQLTPSYAPFSYERRKTEVMEIEGHELGGEHEIRVFTSQEKWNAVAHKIAKMGDYKPEIVIERSGVVSVDPRDEAAISAINAGTEARLVTVADGLDLEVVHAFRMLAFRLDARHPILLKDTLVPAAESGDFVEALLAAAGNIGSLLCDGIGDAVIIQGEPAPGQSLRLSYNVLQAAGARIFKTDYVACPSCGRTLFNLQTTTQKIRAATGHLKGVRIAVMGCIVNGPGEMADADFGYVGGAPGKINLYVGKQAVKFNIPEAEAVDRLIDLIREHGKWIDAPTEEPAEV
ncbi:4-hydroxy-3-methylbut-2-en-1-yldiphosphate synthase [Haloferula helveola]|uniref:4-hydroxy-3-methylbut-2-en-1-yl diphosphate synthase (flavodoxin) n=1 Tax=Haloferula helveola TaxID=490095 RepID=A0ABN6H5Q3_9BACT|nr:4-hydroxy-3-methylbut-2-en-1-yldiphosphate synthase [Haloferula helveola]